MRSPGLQSLAVLLSALAGCAIDDRAISRARDVDAGLGCPAGQRACDGLCERPSDFVPPAGSLRAWFDAACLAPGRLAVWADRSVAANHATAPSTVAAPEVIARGLGGRAAVHFDGVGQHLTLPDGAAPGRNGPFTVVVAGSWDDVATTYNGVIGWGGAVGVHLMVNPGGNVFLWWGERTAASVTAPGVFDRTPVVLAYRYESESASDRGRMTLFRNGEVLRSAIAAVPNAASGTGATVGRAPDYFSTNNPMLGYLGEMLVYARALDDDEVRAVDAYLRARWVP